jgi:hypothetical protein
LQLFQPLSQSHRPTWTSRITWILSQAPPVQLLTAIILIGVGLRPGRGAFSYGIPESSSAAEAGFVLLRMALYAVFPVYSTAAGALGLQSPRRRQIEWPSDEDAK